MRFIAAISLLFVTLFATSPLKANEVNFYAWGGSSEVNSYLRWAQKELQEQGSFATIKWPMPQRWLSN